MNAVGYVRLSRDEDKENYTSILAQRKMIENYALENNLNLIEYYEDDNESGYSFERPSFQKLIRDLEDEEKNISVILSKDLSRIGRHNALTLLFIEQIKNSKKKLILIDEGSGGYDSSKDDDDIIGIKTWYNERYVKDISKKIKSNLKVKQKEGRLLIREYFGYKKHPTDKHKLIIDNETAPIVRLIFKLYIEGNGYRKIADILNEKGFITPSQKIQKQYYEEGKVYKNSVSEKWQLVHVQRIIQNSIYAGVLTLGKTKKEVIKGKSVKTNEEEQYIFEDNHEPIISKEDFELVQQIVSKRNVISFRGHTKNVNVFSGFLFCNDCDSYMVAMNYKTKPKGYVCGNYHKFGVKKCTRHFIREDKLIFLFQEQLLTIKDNLTDFLLTLNEDIKTKLSKKENFNTLISKLEKDKFQNMEELKILTNQKMKDLIKPENKGFEEIIEQNYSDIEKDKMQKVKLLTQQIKEMTLLSKDSKDIEKSTQTAISIIQKIIDKGQPERKDLELILDKIIIKENGVPMFKFIDEIDSMCTHTQVDVLTYCITRFLKKCA